MTISFYTRRLLKEVLGRVNVALKLRGIERKSPILVYQMGKVGSSSVTRALGAAVVQPVLQVHILNQRNLTEGIRATRRSPEVFLPPHLIWSIGLARKLRSGVFPCKIITLTRDPVERLVSFLFENRIRKLPNLTTYEGDQALSYVCDQIQQILAAENPHSDPSLWFDSELREVFGIDVFGMPYDFDTGWTVIEHPVHPVLVLRLEDLDRSLNPSLCRFLQTPGRAFEPTRTNVGSHKHYGTLLKEVKRNLRLPVDTLRRVYSTRYARHFYGPDITSLMSRWSGGPYL